MTETEYKLLNWRGDSLNPERMCADILIMQDFESVDPQSPLGGPDGTKDILCKKRWADIFSRSIFCTTT